VSVADRLAEVEAEEARQEAEKAALAAIVVTTEAAPIGLRVAACLGIVSADVAFGAGPLKDIAVGLSNAFGGRSDTMSTLMCDSRSTALQELRLEAAKLGATAPVGVGFTVTSIGQGGTMTLVSATGTAVKLEG
jgi:uncharacterized protein YbjQ (UPF0145 family)